MNPLLTPQQNAELTALRNANAGSVSHWKTETDYTPTKGGLSDLAHWLARIDWMRVFIVTARVLVSIGLLITAYQYFQYTLFFGAGALAFIGQFLIGVFFAVVVFYTRDGLQIITAAAGMYLLTSSF